MSNTTDVKEPWRGRQHADTLHRYVRAMMRARFTGITLRPA
jgi:hypothetical protein